MKTGVEQDNLQVLMNLLSESRAETGRLRERVATYEHVVMSTRLLMGHELKKPTTALTGYIDLAIETIGAADGTHLDETVEYLRKARKECELLNELNLVFLALLRINGEKEILPVQNIDVHALCSEIIGNFPEEYQAPCRVQVSVADSAEVVQLNRNAFKVIVSNLIENALLYSSTRDKVFVDIGGATDNRREEPADCFHLTITDTGEGIPEEYLQKIFNPFVRLHEGRVDGSGLGLTLVRSLIELYHGEITVKSGRGKGTAILVSIPLETREQESLVL